MTKQPVAIIGIGCRFAGVNNPSEFWKILQDGVHTITKNAMNRPTEMTGWGGFLKNIDQFDAAFFGISAEEAIKIDPQHRLLLETSWEALEDAGLVPANLAGTNTGVLIGLSGSEYLNLLIEDSTFNTTLGTLDCMLANRISSYFDFRGLSLTINAACSSVLVAIDHACQSLWNEDIHLALVGGTHLIFSPVIDSRYVNANLIATDGLCKTFDAKADGYVRGEGIGVVVLKLLSQAQADGDRIYAVIRGSGINHNGIGNGLAAPNMQAQIALLQKVYQRVNIDPSSINYIEANGTATLIGDALEMKALGAVVGKDRTPDNPCRVGCVKTNIGHTEGASGIAGLIKVALSIYHRQIPPTLHFQEPNPAISFAKLGLKVQQTLETLPEEAGPIRAGVSCFSLGGTNAHLILESVPSQAKAESLLFPLQIFTLTAKSSTALQALVQRYQAFLEDQPEASLVDICFMANTRRSQFQYRLAMITESKEQLKEQINMIVQRESFSSVFSGKITRQKYAPICFIFSGKSRQLKPIIKSLYQSQPAIYSLLEELQPFLSSFFTKSFLELMEEGNLENPRHTQVVDFICEYAIAKLWHSWGIEPSIVMGYAMGNYAALVLAEILTVEGAISLILENRKFKSLPNFYPARIRVISAITGKVIEIDETINHDQWQKEFDCDNTENLPNLLPLSNPDLILLDICSPDIQVYNHKEMERSYKIRTPEEIRVVGNLYSLLSTLIKLWLMGVKIDWSKVQNYKHCYPISLPTYPFNSQSYWINVSPTILNNYTSDNQENYSNTEFIAPRDELEIKLTKLWEKVLGRRPIGLYDNFFELGGTSFLATKLFIQIGENFQTDIPPISIYHYPTIEGIADILRGAKKPPSSSSLVPIQPAGNRPPLFGIHYITSYQELSRHLGGEQPVYAVHYPGGPSLPKVEELAAYYIQEIRMIQPEGPYFLMGHSFGGLVAYEMAQQLVAQGQQVPLVALFDTWLPQQLALPFLERLSKLAQLSPAEWFQRFKNITSRYRNRSRLKAAKAYTIKPYSGRVAFFKAMTLIISVNYNLDETELGWRELVTGELQVYEVPGDHITMLNEPHVQFVAQKLQSCIDHI
ncbi:type I polyketide synthase [Cylindrospermopsis raciborskii]|uniref:type I polyketide synthase n=1 Tax=Cylindrospermopsis raciborskii TaxID=77022 RepID=UPI003DA35E4C